MDKETTVSFAKEIIDLAARKCLTVRELRDAAEIAKRMANHSLVEAGSAEQYKPSRPVPYVDYAMEMARRERYEAKDRNK